MFCGEENKSQRQSYKCVCVCVSLFVFGVTTGDSHDAVMGTKYRYAFVLVQFINEV